MLAGPGNAGKSSDMELPSGAMTVPVSRVVNELKCDYLDFAWSDFARARRLAVGRVSGSIVLAIVRDMSRNGTGVAVADRPVRVDRDYVRGAGTVQNALTIPVSFDPKLALDPGSAGLDCSPDARLAQPIVGVAALAAELTRIESAGGAAFGAAGGVTGPVRWQGQFYLRRNRAGGIDVVLVKVDPARVATDGLYLQSVDLTIETAAPSWFGDVGAATAEPRPATTTRPVRRQPAMPVTAPPVRAPAPVREPAPAPTRAAPPTRPSRVIAVPTAPGRRPPVERAPAVEHRCIGDSGADMVCY